MPSTLACLGLSADSPEALETLLDAMEIEDHGSADGVRIVRHVDPCGARVVVGVRDGEALDVVASLDAPIGALVGGLTHQTGLVAADVLDPDTGEVRTRLLADLEQSRCLPHPDAAYSVPDDVQFPASVVALGVEATVHADAEAFAAAQAEAGGTPFAAESFVSYGFFLGAGAESGEPDDGAEPPEPTAFLAGTVLHTDTLTTEASGESFHAVQVRTIGFTATVCLPVSEVPDAPEPGAVVAGTCWLVLDVPALWSLDVGSLTDLVPSGRRRHGWFRRR